MSRALEPAGSRGAVWRQQVAGLTALVCYAVHAGFHLRHGHWPDLMWACHLGAAIVGAGLCLSRPAVNGVGVLLLCLGTPLWLADLAAGGEFYPTSLLTHVGGLALGLYGIAILGLPSGCWWKAALTHAAMIGACRLLTPESANVNMAFAVPASSREQFDSHASYLATTMTLATGYFLVVEFVLRAVVRWSWARHASGETLSANK